MKKEILETLINMIQNDQKDSLEFGTPAKGGAIKIYCDLDNLEATKAKIDRAMLARDYAQEKMPKKE